MPTRSSFICSFYWNPKYSPICIVDVWVAHVQHVSSTARSWSLMIPPLDLRLVFNSSLFWLQNLKLQSYRVKKRPRAGQLDIWQARYRAFMMHMCVCINRWYNLLMAWGDMKAHRQVKDKATFYVEDTTMNVTWWSSDPCFFFFVNKLNIQSVELNRHFEKSCFKMDSSFLLRYQLEKAFLLPSFEDGMCHLNWQQYRKEDGQGFYPSTKERSLTSSLKADHYDPQGLISGAVLGKLGRG